MACKFCLNEKLFKQHHILNVINRNSIPVKWVWKIHYQVCSLTLLFSARSEDDYSEEEEDDDEEEEEYDGEIPQPKLEPRSRRGLVVDTGVCVIPGGENSEEEEEEDEEDEEHDIHREDSDSDGPVPFKEEESDEEEEPLSKHRHIMT